MDIQALRRFEEIENRFGNCTPERGCEEKVRRRRSIKWRWGLYGRVNQ